MTFETSAFPRRGARRKSPEHRPAAARLLVGARQLASGTVAGAVLRRPPERAGVVRSVRRHAADRVDRLQRRGRLASARRDAGVGPEPRDPVGALRRLSARMGSAARPARSSIYGRAESMRKEILSLGVHPRGLPPNTHPHSISDVNALTHRPRLGSADPDRAAASASAPTSRSTTRRPISKPISDRRTRTTCSCAGARSPAQATSTGHVQFGSSLAVQGRSGSRASGARNGSRTDLQRSDARHAMSLERVLTNAASPDESADDPPGDQVHVHRRPVGTARRHRARCHRRRARTGARNRRRAAGSPHPHRVPDRQDRRRRADAAARRAQVVRRAPSAPRTDAAQLGALSRRRTACCCSSATSSTSRSSTSTAARSCASTTSSSNRRRSTATSLLERRRRRRRRARRHPPARRRASSRRSRCGRCSRRFRRASSRGSSSTCSRPIRRGASS